MRLHSNQVTHIFVRDRGFFCFSHTPLSCRSSNATGNLPEEYEVSFGTNLVRGMKTKGTCSLSMHAQTHHRALHSLQRTMNCNVTDCCLRRDHALLRHGRHQRDDHRLLREHARGGAQEGDGGRGGGARVHPLALQQVLQLPVRVPRPPTSDREACAVLRDEEKGRRTQRAQCRWVC